MISATLASPGRDREARDHVALLEWASTLYEDKTVIAAGEIVGSVALEGGGEVQVAAKTALRAVVRSAAPVRPTFTLPATFAQRPADGAPAGSVVFRADGVKLGTVELVVAPEPAPSPSPPPSPEAQALEAPEQAAAEW